VGRRYANQGHQDTCNNGRYDEDKIQLYQFGKFAKKYFEEPDWSGLGRLVLVYARAGLVIIPKSKKAQKINS